MGPPVVKTLEDIFEDWGCLNIYFETIFKLKKFFLIFRQVYIRWSSTFLNLSLDNTQQTLDLLIHQMAAELGSHRALSILQLFFDGELNFNNNKNMRLIFNLFKNNLFKILRVIQKITTIFKFILVVIFRVYSKNFLILIF